MLKRLIRSCSLALVLGAVMAPAPAAAFCGFYVAKADTSLFNQASKVVLARQDDKTIMTMANDFQGDAQDFAIVIPVPTFIEEGQIHVTENAIIDHLDAYTAPRLVEYFDEDPCNPRVYEESMLGNSVKRKASGPVDKMDAAGYGVTIEAEYTVGEYDILILSAEQSEGLYHWLNKEGYKLPDGAKRILKSYIKQEMRFFVAKVNLAEQAKLGYSYLRPLQVAYQHEKFMLPIRLGTLNANGPQEIFLFTLTEKGRVETSNYRTVRIPSDLTIPLFVEGEFAQFYHAMFDEVVRKEDMRAVFLEYAWDMGWCDPCAADPLSAEELRELGVFWLGDNMNKGGGQNAFVTRLHVRYTADTFPEDLQLQETADRSNFQGRYIMQHPWSGKPKCDAAKDYLATLPQRFEDEAQTLARITRWDIDDIRSKMEEGGQSFTVPDFPEQPSPWWKKIWGDDE